MKRSIDSLLPTVKPVSIPHLNVYKIEHFLVNDRSPSPSVATSIFQVFLSPFNKASITSSTASQTLRIQQPCLHENTLIPEANGTAETAIMVQWIKRCMNIVSTATTGESSTPTQRKCPSKGMLRTRGSHDDRSAFQVGTPSLHDQLHTHISLSRLSPPTVDVPFETLHQTPQHLVLLSFPYVPFSFQHSLRSALWHNPFRR